jgi:hypothetical protein
MPLWPFSSQAGADAWLSEYRSGGHQPWHRDADLTAQVFTTGFLGFAVVNDVLAVNERADGAHVDVGYHDPAGQTHIAATVHLVKYGTAPDSPWEVVGTDDSSLTVDQPRYGSTVTSPVTVGGRITGVDESIVVSIRQSWSPQPLGTVAGLPAGGERAPWSQTVSFAGTRPGALTIVASTGGHLQDVERFAVQGVLAKAGA